MLVYTLIVDNSIDTITNSSSELFVAFNTKKNIEFLLELNDSAYLKDYHPLKTIDELTTDELKKYLTFTYYKQPEWYEGFDLPEDCIVRDSEYRDWWTLNPDYIEDIKKAISYGKDMVFLFSKYDNPDFETQEKFERFMERCHLG